MLNGEKVGGEMWLSEMIAQQDRFMRLKRYTLLYLSYAHLARSNWDDANRTIQILRALPPSNETVSIHLTSLLLATQAQYHGLFDKAKEHYNQIPQNAGEIYLLSLLNQTLLYHDTSKPSNLTKSNNFLNQVEEKLHQAGSLPSNSHILPQIRAAYAVIKGLISPEVLRSKYSPSSH
jgi:hypothetical protein